MSLGGSVTAAIFSTASSSTRPSGHSPVSTRSASRARMGVGPAPHRASRARETRPPPLSVTSAATPTSAKSPARRAISTKRAARSRRQARHADIGQELLRLQGGGEDPGEELIGRHRTATALPAERQLGLQRHHHRRQLGGGIGVRQAPAHGAAMTDRQVADQATGLGDDRQLPPDRAGPLERVLSRQRADGQTRVHRPDVRQLGDAVHVDQDLGLGEPEVQERHQALSPGQDLGAIPMLGEQGHGFVGGAGRLVLEGRRFHGGLPLVIDRTRTLGEGLSVAREGAAVNARTVARAILLSPWPRDSGHRRAAHCGLARGGHPGIGSSAWPRTCCGGPRRLV